MDSEADKTELDLESSSSFDKNTFWTLALFVSLIIIMACSTMIATEYLGARKFCGMINGTLDVDFANGVYYCDGEQFFRYTDGAWGYENRTIMITGYTRASKSYAPINYSQLL